MAQELAQLANDSREAVLEGSLLVLVGLLHAGPEADATKHAVGALVDLSLIDDNRARLRQAGAVEPAVALLHATAAAPTSITSNTAKLLGNLANGSMEGMEAVGASGAISPLILMLRAQPRFARSAACALANLAHWHEANRTAIIEAGAIGLLVPLLLDSSSASDCSRLARNLSVSDSEAGAAALHAAGAAVPLVALLHATEAKTAEDAAAVLNNMAVLGTDGARSSILAALAARPPPPSTGAKPVLRTMLKWMRWHALPRLRAAKAADDAAALEEAVAEATAVHAPAADLERARGRLAALRERAEAARRERRASLGLDELPTPAEFICPIERDVMMDPVVASDGHTYERSAIKQVLGWEEGRATSPMTREPLQPFLFPNIALRQRIQAHAADVEAAAERAVQKERASLAQPAARAECPAPSARAAVKPIR